MFVWKYESINTERKKKQLTQSTTTTIKDIYKKNNGKELPNNDTKYKLEMGTVSVCSS